VSDGRQLQQRFEVSTCNLSTVCQTLAPQRRRSGSFQCSRHPRQSRPDASDDRRTFPPIRRLGSERPPTPAGRVDSQRLQTRKETSIKARLMKCSCTCCVINRTLLARDRAVCVEELRQRSHCVTSILILPSLTALVDVSARSYIVGGTQGWIKNR